MKKQIGLLFAVFFALYLPVLAQNKDTTLVSITNFRLDPGTFSWRGTNTFYDMTTWNSSPYTEGHLKQKSGANWVFRMNYRLLLPVGYDANYNPGYPIIIMLHGGGERGNCRENDCYCDGCSPNATPDPAADPRFLNNDHVLLHGGQPHLSAVNLAGTKKPDDPTLNDRAFPGFVLFPQMENAWGSPDQNNSAISYTIRIIRLMVKEYNIDPDRIYIHGLSMGGQGVYKAMNMADWLFAAAASMSGLYYTNNLEYDSVAHIPLWVFQGGLDTNPTPNQTAGLIKRFREAGGIARHTLYPNLGHGTWNTAYKEADFFSWFLSRKKNDIHVYFDNPNICTTTGAGVKLGLAEGFPAYQWERDGQVIAGANSHTHIATAPGVYRARFSRVSSAPAEAQWNKWSTAVTVGEQTPAQAEMGQEGTVVLKDLNNGSDAVLTGAPGAAHYYWFKDDVQTTLPDSNKVVIKPGTCGTPCSNAGRYTLVTAGFDNCPGPPSDPRFVFFEDQAPVDDEMRPTVFSFKLTSPSSVLLNWNDNSAKERHYEVWRKNTSVQGARWEMAALTGRDITSFHDTGLIANAVYYYKIRAVSRTSRSEYHPGPDKSAAGDNLVITTPDGVPPTPPQNLTAELTGINTITLSWEAATDASGIKEYIVSYGNTSVPIGSTATSYTVSGLTVNTTYSFTVKAVNISGIESPPSNQVTTNTSMSGLYYKHSTGSWIDLDDPELVKTWTMPEFTGKAASISLAPRTQDDFFNFEFEGYLNITTPGIYTFYINSDDGSRLFLDNNLAIDFNGRHGQCSASETCPNGWGRPSTPMFLAAGPHLIKVHMFEYTGNQQLFVRYNGPDTGNSTTVIPETALNSGPYTPPPSPATPGNFAAAVKGMTRIDLSWNFSGSAQFELYRSAALNGPFSIINRVSELSYPDTGLTPGKAYYYKARTVNGNGSSAFTTVVKATTTTDTESPTQPTGLTAFTTSSYNASLSWNESSDNTGVTGYEIWANGKRIGTSPYPGYQMMDLAPDSSYTFSVIAYDANGNKSPASETVSIQVVTGLEEDPSRSFTLEVFPNPAPSGNIRIKVTTRDRQPVEVSIVDVMSKSLYNGTFEPSLLGEGVDLPLHQSLANGVYVVFVRQEQKVTRQRLLIRN